MISKIKNAHGLGVLLVWLTLLNRKYFTTEQLSTPQGLEYHPSLESRLQISHR